jgi:ribosomal protein S18 acetylase RimI-like enzyme
MTFRTYQAGDKERCLELFRSNVPKFFAPHEEAEFATFLDGHPESYFVLECEKILGCGGYGVAGDTGFLAWGMVERSQHGAGLGKRLLLERLSLMTQHDVKSILLDTSQHTFGFFEKLGFMTINITEHGYGENLHRYDMKLGLDKDSRRRVQKLLFGAKGFSDDVINQQKEHD